MLIAFSFDVELPVEFYNFELIGLEYFTLLYNTS